MRGERGETILQFFPASWQTQVTRLLECKPRSIAVPLSVQKEKGKEKEKKQQKEMRLPKPENWRSGCRLQANPRTCVLIVVTYPECARENMGRRQNTMLRAAVPFNTRNCRGPNAPIEIYARVSNHSNPD